MSNQCCRRKAISIICSVCVCVCVCVCSLSYPACNGHEPYTVFIAVATRVAPYFPTLSHKMHDFGGGGGGGGGGGRY